ncbi:MAG: hypothetical protein H0U71_00210 [Gammaproteobacteria bacterium]|nr:hypothetical protein [Gammaproteobacteria bacterium]
MVLITINAQFSINDLILFIGKSGGIEDEEYGSYATTFFTLLLLYISEDIDSNLIKLIINNLIKDENNNNSKPSSQMISLQKTFVSIINQVRPDLKSMLYPLKVAVVNSWESLVKDINPLYRNSGNLKLPSEYMEVKINHQEIRKNSQLLAQATRHPSNFIFASLPRELLCKIAGHTKISQDQEQADAEKIAQAFFNRPQIKP